MNPTDSSPDPSRSRGDSNSDPMAEIIDRYEDEGSAALEDVCARYPDRADALRRKFAMLMSMGLVGEVQADPTPKQLGEYRVLGPLGHGGMGVVYRAWQESLGREVALKLIRPEHLHFPQSRERFAREVAVVGKLDHPGIVPVYAVGDADGVPYFAMQLVRGRSLEEVLGELRQRRIPISRLRGDELAAGSGADARIGSSSRRRPEGSYVDACLEIAQQVAEALQHAHEAGVLHRDVKPSNIMLAEDGRAMLLDFGLAACEGDSGLTRSGVALGSTAYMSPEQREGRWGDVTARTDVYSLGVSLYEMLTLVDLRSVESSSAVTPWAQRAEPLRRHDSSIPWDVDTVCRAAMDPDPARRYPTAAAFAADLENLRERRPIQARRPGLLLRCRRYAQRHPARTAAMAVGLVAIVGAFVAAELGAFRGEQRAAAAERRSNDLADATRRLEEETLRRDYHGRILSAEQLLDDGAVAQAREVLTGCAPELRCFAWYALDLRADSAMLTLEIPSQFPRSLQFDESLESLIAITPEACFECPLSGGAEPLELVSDLGLDHRGAGPCGPYVLRLVGDQVRVVERSTGRTVGQIDEPGVFLVYSLAQRSEALLFTRSELIVVRLPGGEVTSRFDLPVDQPGAFTFAYRAPSHEFFLRVRPGRFLLLDLDGERPPRSIDSQPFGIATFLNGSGDLVLGGADDELVTLDAEGLEPKASIEFAGGMTQCLGATGDGGTVISGHIDGAVRTWRAEDLEPGRVFSGHTAPITAVAVHPSDRWMASADKTGTLKLWDLGRDRAHRIVRRQTGLAVRAQYSQNLRALAFSPDGGTLAAAYFDGSVCLWDLERGVLANTLLGHRRGVWHIAYSGDGSRLVCSDGAGEVILWSSAGDRLRRWHLPECLEARLALDPVGARLAVLGMDSTRPLLFDTATGALVEELTGVDEPLREFVFDGTGEHLVARAVGGGVFVWRAADGEYRGELQSLRQGVERGWWSEGDRALAMVDDAVDRLFREWPTHDARPHASALRTAISGDARRMVTASFHGEVRLYDVADGSALTTLESRGGMILGLAYSHDGRRIAFGNMNGDLHVLDSRRDRRTPLEQMQCTAAIEGATRWLESVPAESARVLELEDQAERDPSLGGAEREQVFELLWGQGEDPQRLLQRAWTVALQVSRTDEEYERAHRWLEAAEGEVEDESWWCLARALLFERQRKYQQALAPAERAIELGAAHDRGVDPYAWIVVAVSQYGLGRFTEARAALDRARAVASEAPWSRDRLARSMIHAWSEDIEASAADG